MAKKGNSKRAKTERGPKAKSSSGVTFFEGVEEGGLSLTRLVNEDVKNLRQFDGGEGQGKGFWNDRISSLKVDPGVKVIVYRDKNFLDIEENDTPKIFRSTSWKARNLWEYFKNFDKKISSFKVMADS